MIKIKFLPCVCEHYPDEMGWVEKEFDTNSAMLEWIENNRHCIELVHFVGEECEWVELRHE